MASNAFAGVGTEFRRWDTTTELWNNISEITNITGPGFTRDMIDVTNLDSVNGWREYIPGFRDGGTVVLSMNFTNDALETMRTDFLDDNDQNYEISFTEGTTIEFTGFVQEFPVTIPTDSQVTMEVTIKVTGPVAVNSGELSATPTTQY